MNDAEYARHKQRILALCERWIKATGLGWWAIEMTYVRSDFEIDGKPEPGTIASTTANWRYGHAHVTWNMSKLADIDDDELERSFVHELMHIFLNETRIGSDHDDWIDHEERVASTLTKAFLWLRDAILESQAPPQTGGNGVVTVVASTGQSWTTSGIEHVPDEKAEEHA